MPTLACCDNNLLQNTNTKNNYILYANDRRPLAAPKIISFKTLRLLETLTFIQQTHFTLKINMTTPCLRSQKLFTSKHTDKNNILYNTRHLLQNNKKYTLSK